MTEDQDFLDELDDNATEQGNSQPTADAVPLGTLELGEADQVPDTQPAPTPPVAEQPKPEPQHVPITALLDERDKRKAMEQELERLRAAQQPAQTVEAPDMFEDPDGFAAYQQQMSYQTTLNAKLDISEDMARDKFGDEKVETAKNWALQQFAADPAFQKKVLSQRNPYRFVVEQYDREQMVSQVTPDDFAQFQAWKAAQTQLEAQTKPTPPAVPPRSLASAPSAGGISTEPIPSEEEMFADVIRK